jgi:AhpC/TSA family
MNKFLYTISLIMSVAVGSFAQTLRLDLPYYQGREVVLVQRQGIRNDTIGFVKLDTKGRATVATNRAQSVGLGALLIGADIQHPFVLSPTENALIRSENEVLKPQNTRIENSMENTSLARLGMKTRVLQAKIMGIEQLLTLYETPNTFSKILVKEQSDLTQTLSTLKDTLRKSPLFCAQYIHIRDLLETTFKNTPQSETTMQATRKALLNDIDIAVLHGSDMWFEVLNNSLEAYQKGTPLYNQFGEDMVALMKKTNADRVVGDLAEAALSICTKYAWNKDQETLVAYLANANRIRNPQGALKKLIQMQATAVGKKAPDLVITQHIGQVEEHNHQTTVLKSSELSTNRSLVVFYQSGCGHCETAMNGLRTNYEALQKKGIEIKAISGDTDELVFRNTANSYPWKASYCDLEGLSGVNFKNYAVLGTPTIYLIDKNGNIEDKMASIEEVLKAINLNN